MGDTKPRGNQGPRDEQGRWAEDITDLSRYAKGDRDPAAREAKAQDMRERRAAAREAAGAERPATDDTWDRRHSIRLSARLEDIIDALRGDTPLGAWIRDAAIERAARESGVTADDLDTAKRPAQRRANYSERQQADGTTEGQER